MKKFFLVLLAFCLVASIPLFGQTIVNDTFTSLKNWTPAYGTWKADGSLVQSNLKTGLALINRAVPQTGVYQLEFTVKYQDGGYASDAKAAAGKYHGGFGIHIGVDKPATKASWGDGKSYLLWINLDTEVAKTSPYYGFRAQVYQSFSNSSMKLLDDYNLELYSMDEVMEYLDYVYETLYVKMIVDTATGEIQIEDPFNGGFAYVYLDPAMLKGNYIGLRTNMLGVAFDDFKVTQISK